MSTPTPSRGSGRSSILGALAAVWGDARFLRYLCGSMIFQLGNELYNPIVRPFLSTELHFNYKQCVFIADVLPSMFSLVTTPRLGAAWLDRDEPADRLEPDPASAGASTRCCSP